MLSAGICRLVCWGSSRDGHLGFTLLQRYGTASGDSKIPFTFNSKDSSIKICREETRMLAESCRHIQLISELKKHSQVNTYFLSKSEVQIVKPISENIFLQHLALEVTANCICETHFLALDGSDLNTVL